MFHTYYYGFEKNKCTVGDYAIKIKVYIIYLFIIYYSIQNLIEILQYNYSFK